MLTREEIIERLRDMRRLDWMYEGMGDYIDGDYCRYDDILDIIKEAESE